MEHVNETKYMFLSFVGGKQNGACIVEASNIEEAVEKTHNLKLNPGGEVLGFDLTDEDFKKERNMEINTFYTSEEMKEKGYQSIKEAKEEHPEIKDHLDNDPKVNFICQDCNDEDCNC